MILALVARSCTYPLISTNFFVTLMTSGVCITLTYNKIYLSLMRKWIIHINEVQVTYVIKYH